MLIFINMHVYNWSVFLLLFYRKHLLLMLLSLEYIVISIYFSLFFYLLMYQFNMYMLMIYMVMIVCEGVLGLSILVLMIRAHGNDYMKTFNLLW
uniref:NADH-ubiquinone oxidoreductase chain 4L n=1 Tax=Scydmaeninae sp. 840218 TaxID=1213605 RepID=A0A0S2MP78_9COLE|nr:NADH deshydrogenase subunit 4L [Scydmaeninae sp. 840218]